MRITFINKSDSVGGAAVVTLRLVEALRQLGHDARLVVTDRRTDREYVALGGSEGRIRTAFLADRLPLLLSNGFRRSTLFQIDAARAGLPLWRHDWVRNADAIVLGWINQGVLSLDGIRRIGLLNKPLLWTLHDMWALTGVCHHAHDCQGYRRMCGNCQLLGGAASGNDLSAVMMERKRRLYDRVDIQFVAVSRWLAEKARESTLLGEERVAVIPNPYPVQPMPRRKGSPAGHIVMAAARLDDPIKGFPLLIEAVRALRRRNPQLTAGLHFDLIGEMRNPEAAKALEAEYTLHGMISDSARMRQLYAAADAVVSPSLFETLPGTLVEAQDCGAVPVAFDRGGQRDIIVPGKTGFIAPWNDDPRRAGENFADSLVQALELAADPATPKLLHEAVVNNFAAEKVARQYVQLIENQ